VADVIYEETLGRGVTAHAIDAPARDLRDRGEGEDLLVPVLRGGALVYTVPPLAAVAGADARSAGAARRLPGVRQLQGPVMAAATRWACSTSQNAAGRGAATRGGRSAR
jgi:hypothetical protein